MEKFRTLYHGSIHTIQKPIFGLGRKNNDFGFGFYCTESLELAKEWAVSSFQNGYANQYTLNTEYLNILNLNTPEYSILNWIAVLIEHRIFPVENPVAGRAKKYLLENFGINVNAYDVIVGYRADDSYFDFAQAFLNNAITVNQLAKAMRLGKLGEQIVLKSEFAFQNIQFEGSHIALKDEYFTLRSKRLEQANQMYLSMLEEESDGLFIQDLMRGGIQNDNPCIPRNVCK